MPQQEKVLAAKLDDLSSVLGNHIVERETNSGKLSTDLHKHVASREHT